MVRARACAASCAGCGGVKPRLPSREDRRGAGPCETRPGPHGSVVRGFRVEERTPRCLTEGSGGEYLGPMPRARALAAWVPVVTVLSCAWPAAAFHTVFDYAVERFEADGNTFGPADGVPDLV